MKYTVRHHPGIEVAGKVHEYGSEVELTQKVAAALRGAAIMVEPVVEGGKSRGKGADTTETEGDTDTTENGVITP